MMQWPYDSNVKDEMDTITDNDESSSSPILPHDNDVLNGRGVNIAKHPGNLRFRSLITTYLDESYCFSYTVVEKKALARDIIHHISKLNPPGRFLTRASKDKKSKGLEGAWYLMDEKETLKKTCQALRDCNRTDRSGYAKGVKDPEDVKHLKKHVKKEGLSVRDLARVALQGKHLLDEEMDIDKKVKKKKKMDNVNMNPTMMQNTAIQGQSSGNAKSILHVNHERNVTTSATLHHETATRYSNHPKDDIATNRIVVPVHHNDHHHNDHHNRWNGNRKNEIPPPSLEAPIHNFHPPAGNFHHRAYRPSTYKDDYLRAPSQGYDDPYIPCHSKFSPMKSNRENTVVIKQHPAAGMAPMKHHDYYYRPATTTEPLQTTLKEDPSPVIYCLGPPSTNISKSTSTSSPMTPLAHMDDPYHLNMGVTRENQLDGTFDSNELEDILDFDDDTDFLFELDEGEVH